jgi:hypothetical protein
VAGFATYQINKFLANRFSLFYAILTVGNFISLETGLKLTAGLAVADNYLRMSRLSTLVTPPSKTASDYNQQSSSSSMKTVVNMSKETIYH